jgi:hypothetical protein
MQLEKDHNVLQLLDDAPVRADHSVAVEQLHRRRVMRKTLPLLADDDVARTGPREEFRYRRPRRFAKQ